METSEGNESKEEAPQEAEDAPPGAEGSLEVPRADFAGEDVDIEDEAEAQRALRDPGMPSKQEREEHELTHLPFRPWCAACIRGRAKDKMSLRLPEAYSQCRVPRVRMDYCYLTDKSGEEEGEEGKGDEESAGESATVLVVQESVCRSVWAYMVDRKGAAEDWAVNQIADDLDTVGLRGDRIIIKSDQEASVIDTAKGVAEVRASQHGAAIEHSAVGDSDSNGTIERTIQDVEQQVRVLRAALEIRVNRKIRINEAVVPWMIRHAAGPITRCRVRPCGKTSYQLMKGRKSNAKLAEFGEVVHFRIPKTPLMPKKFEDLWNEGVWLGFDMRTGEYMVGTAVGVFRVATVKRKPINERWSSDRISSLRGSPKQPVPNQASQRAPAYSKKYEAPMTKDIFVPQSEQPVGVKNWKIYKEDILKYGPTEGCPGCRNTMRGSSVKAGHTEQCRIRMRDLVSQTEAGKERIARAEARAARAQEENAPPGQGGEKSSKRHLLMDPPATIQPPPATNSSSGTSMQGWPPENMQ